MGRESNGEAIVFQLDGIRQEFKMLICIFERSKGKPQRPNQE